MTYSVLQRYTPPTCTLEIMAKNSPLSRWASQPVLKNVRFQLSLDDPKLPKEQWVTIRGDRTQLEALCEIVQSYVQNLLQQTHSHFNPMVSATTVTAAQARLAVAELEPSEVRTLAPRAMGVSLQPTGLFAHQLTLGALAAEQSASVVHLSTLQLFDLANALDDYASDVLALPSLQRPSWLKSAPSWGQVAAAAVLVIGVSASVVKFVDRSANAPNVANTSGASSSDQRIANQLPPTGAAENSGRLPVPVSPQTVPVPPPLTSSTPLPSPGFPTTSVPNAANLPPGSRPETNIAAKSTASQPNRPTSITGDISSGSGNTGRSQKNSITIAGVPQGSVLSSSSIPASPSSPATAESADARLSERRDAAQTQGSTAFDTIPQVAEARSYFQQRWKPPAGLTQTLEYTLQVDATGAIEIINPLGQAAKKYLGDTPIPTSGETFVSPLKGARSAKIRLVLSPDGGVQTFLESSK